MKAGLVTALAMVSAALTVIVVAGWIRSLSSADLLSYQYVRRTPLGLREVTYLYGASGGSNFLKRDELRLPTIRSASSRSSSGVWRWSAVPAPGRQFFGGLGDTSWGHALGFVAESWRSVSPTPGLGQVKSVVSIVRFPHWFLLLFTLPPLGLSLRCVVRDRRRRRRRCMGLCERCGYDLRANAGACPECGMERSEVPRTEREGMHPPYAGGNS